MKILCTFLSFFLRFHNIILFHAVIKCCNMFEERRVVIYERDCVHRKCKIGIQLSVFNSLIQLA